MGDTVRRVTNFMDGSVSKPGLTCGHASALYIVPSFF